jgi:Ca2+-transporting ATPase
VVFNAIVVAEIGIIFAIRSLFLTPKKINLWLWITVLITILLQVLIMYSPAAKIFGVTALNLSTLSWILSVGLFVYLVGKIYISVITKKSLKADGYE